MKSIMLWVNKGARKPKQVGLATASGSALAIYDFTRMAAAQKGVFWIVDADNVNHARKIIQSYKQGADLPAVSNYNDRVIAIGETAVRALQGAGRSILKWEERRLSQGAVSRRQSSALDPLNLDY